MIPEFRAWWRRKVYGEDLWQPFRVGVTRGAMPSWGKDGGWEIQGGERGDVRLCLTDRGARRVYPFSTYEAQQFANQLRDHALAMGGLPYMTDEDQARRQAIYRERALPKATLWP